MVLLVAGDVFAAAIQLEIWAEFARHLRIQKRESGRNGRKIVGQFMRQKRVVGQTLRTHNLHIRIEGPNFVGRRVIH